jgi:hypothetical protein
MKPVRFEEPELPFSETTEIRIQLRSNSVNGQPKTTISAADQWRVLPADLGRSQTDIVSLEIAPVIVGDSSAPIEDRLFAVWFGRVSVIGGRDTDRVPARAGHATINVRIHSVYEAKTSRNPF